MASKTLNTILNLQDNTTKKLVGVASGFKELSKEAQKATLSAQKSLNKLGTGIQNSVTKAVKSIGKIGIAVGALAIGKGITEGMDLEGYRVQLETATKSTQKAAEIMKYSIDLANKTPFEGGEMVEASSKLESMGISAKTYLNQIVDMAAATNKPLDQATEAFIDAQTGELERLKEFGIKKADIAAKANEMFAGQETINAKGQIVNQENFNKALLSIMQDRYKGGAEKLANTTKGMLSTVTGITKSALAKIVGVQEDGTIKSGSLLDLIKNKVKTIADTLQKWQSDGTLDRIAQKATQAFSIVGSVVGNALNFIIKHKDVIITLASMALTFTLVSKAVKGVSIAMKVFQVAWALLNGTIALSPIGWIIIGITAVVGILTLLWTKCAGFRKAVTQLGQTIMQWFSSTILPLLQQTWTKLQTLWNTVIIPFATWLMTKLQPIFETVFPVIERFVNDCFSGIGLSIQGAIKMFNGIIDFVTGIFTGNWQLAWDGIQEIFGGCFDGLIGLAKGPLNTVIDLVNKAIDGVNSFKVDAPDWLPVIGGKNYSLNIPHIPRLATGSHYTKEGMTLVGEHGPELRYMNSGDKISTNSETKKMLNGSTNPIQIYINTFIGEESFADRCGQIIGRRILSELSNM